MSMQERAPTPALEMCAERQLINGKMWICTRTDHGWYFKGSDYVATYRRKHGKIPAPDRHYMERRG